MLGLEKGPKPVMSQIKGGTVKRQPGVLIVAILLSALLAGEALARGGRGSGPATHPRGASGPQQTGGPPAAAHRTPGQPGPGAGGPALHAPGNPGLYPPGGASLFGGNPPPASATGSGRQTLQQHLGLSSPTGQVRTAAGEAVSGWVQSGPEPFSPAWYAEHPNAWQATHPYAAPAAIATTTALAAWLAVPVVTVGVLGEASASDGQATPLEEDTAAQTSLAPPATEEPAADAGWMTLGTFALRPADQPQATRMIQLAVSREGAIRGSHYDLLSDTAQSIQGAVDKKSQRVWWSIGPRSNVRFEAPLAELAKPQGQWTVRLPNGTSAAWQTIQVSP